jgi:geranylgeranyl reductase family protein
MRTEVLVIGAGPAGSAAAARLAEGGAHVVLVDQHPFPRDKICGDALIADALRALDRLGLLQQVLDAARRLSGMRIYAPDQSFVDIAGEMAMLPREALDEMLRATAVERGAVFLAPLALEEVVEEAGSVAGGRFRDRTTGESTEIRAELTILATGASSSGLEAAGVCRRSTPSAVAARIYFRVPEATARQWDRLCIVFDAGIFPGYGWIFPGPDEVFNVGVGCFRDTARRPASENIREIWRRFLETFTPVRELVAGAEPLGDLRGAPIRCALVGADLFRPGLLVVGEAAGATYSFSGEGIGKAMETGMLAADLARRWLDGDIAAGDIGPCYAREVRQRFGPRFDAYRHAQEWLSIPVLCNLLAARARRGRFVKAQLSALLNETGDPGVLFSPLGLAKALVL